MNQSPMAFEYKISLGQNFILDRELQRKLVGFTCIGPEDTVLEVGSGRGDMTEALAEKCARLVSVEIDSRLEPVLLDRFAGKNSVEIVIGDIMKLDISKLMCGQEPFHVVGNLPYYLTTPILMLLLRSGLPIRSLNVMVQKEAAQRVTASAGTPEYGPLAIMAAYRGTVCEAMSVPARCFTPPPKVDSVFLTMAFHAAPPCVIKDENLFFRLVDSAFLMRRKTLANNLMRAFSLSRKQATDALFEAGLGEMVRGEELNLNDFAILSGVLGKIS